MKEASINARIPSDLKDQITVECKKKGISLTAYIIRALTHELHGRESDLIVVQELNDLKNLIDLRINEYNCNTNCNTDVSQKEVKDLKYYLNQIKIKQENKNCVPEQYLKLCADNIGITFKELLQTLTEEGIDIVIT